MMPEMDGIEVCRRIKSNPAMAEVSVVMLTALCMDAAKAATKKAGANGFFMKPLNDETLFLCVRKFMRT
jgi:two-component system cell cycle response regulator